MSIKKKEGVTVNIAILIRDLCGGGAERTAQIIGDYYVKKGENVYYFLLNKKNKSAYEVKGEIVYMNLEEFRHNGIYGRKWTSFIGNVVKAASIIKRKKREYRINVTFSFMEECNYLNILSKCEDKVIAGVRTFISERSDLKDKFYNKHFIRIVYNRADVVVGCAKSVSNDLCTVYGIKRNKLVSITNGYIPRSQDVSHLQWEHGEKCIIVIARLDSIKQHDRIIKAFTFVREKYADAKLILLGNGKTEAYLRWFCEQMGVSNEVVFAGFVSDIEYYLKHSRIYVMASVAEGLPNGMIEAMSCGIPVVTTDTPGGCRDIIGKDENCIADIEYCKYGICTPYMKGKARLTTDLDVEERMLGEAMYRLLSDDDLYRQYVQKSLDRATDFTYEEMMNRYDELVYKP